MEIADIPNLPSREQRFEEITVDCYNEDEALSAFEVYLSEALQTPFAARWGAPGTERMPVIVFGAASGYDDDGVLLRVRLADGDEQEVLADQLWAVETPGVNATVLDDYRAFVAVGGLPFDDDEDAEEWDEE
ncbi:calcium-binding protein [Oscillochloris sp. ZM17-4]|uniref:calcium-binding protein n=1 Tax=Oscillochloris sp. ZM17-4 TaxID=2866714 RepID=UPI001C737380|nr:calcium-binding protein [Oscillochloris sp. ZM17-4]MBX0326605.1 calcium-binding protein [Oscillochloris sp. ZM17-4]